MGKMDDENCSQHHDNYADRSDAKQCAGQDSEAARELCQPHEIPDDHRHLHERREVPRPWSAESAEKNGAAVIEKGKCACKSHDQKPEIQFACDPRVKSARRAHDCLPFQFRRLRWFIKSLAKTPAFCAKLGRRNFPGEPRASPRGWPWNG